MKRGRALRTDIRGPKTGRCNICGQDGPLTVDHTPPKSCGGVTAAQVRTLTQQLGNGVEGKRNTRLQTRVARRTLCERCNTLLGHQYDPALADFCRQVRTAADAVVHLPVEFRARIRPQAVIRSVLGHMVAFEPDRYLKGAVTEPLRDYILDASRSLPDSIKVYYWFYPYQQTVHVPGAALGTLGVRGQGQIDPVFFWLLKFYPLAFMATIDANSNPTQVESLNFFRTATVTDEHEVLVPLAPVKPSHWPELPDNDGNIAVLHGPGGAVSRPIARVRR